MKQKNENGEKNKWRTTLTVAEKLRCDGSDEMAKSRLRRGRTEKGCVGDEMRRVTWSEMRRVKPGKGLEIGMRCDSARDATLPLEREWEGRAEASLIWDYVSVILNFGG